MEYLVSLNKIVTLEWYFSLFVTVILLTFYALEIYSVLSRKQYNICHKNYPKPPIQLLNMKYYILDCKSSPRQGEPNHFHCCAASQGFCGPPHKQLKSACCAPAHQLYRGVHLSRYLITQSSLISSPKKYNYSPTGEETLKVLPSQGTLYKDLYPWGGNKCTNTCHADKTIRHVNRHKRLTPKYVHRLFILSGFRQLCITRRL